MQINGWCKGKWALLFLKWGLLFHAIVPQVEIRLHWFLLFIRLFHSEQQDTVMEGWLLSTRFLCFISICVSANLKPRCCQGFLQSGEQQGSSNLLLGIKHWSRALHRPPHVHLPCGFFPPLTPACFGDARGSERSWPDWQWTTAAAPTSEFLLLYAEAALRD